MERTDIPIGRQNAITRADLAGIWGCSDRTARQKIADLRASPGKDGYVILSTSHEPKGYWRSNDPKEIEQFIRETEARAKSTFLSLKDARRVLKAIQHSDQIRFQEESA